MAILEVTADLAPATEPAWDRAPLGGAEYVLWLIRLWKPNLSRPHCSRCRCAVVSGTPDDPQVRCRAGHGDERPIWQIIRNKSPYGFKQAKVCDEYEPGWDPDEFFVPYELGEECFRK